MSLIVFSACITFPYMICMSAHNNSIMPVFNYCSNSLLYLFECLVCMNVCLTVWIVGVIGGCESINCTILKMAIQYPYQTCYDYRLGLLS